MANIGVKIWQESLEREYNVRYEEAKTLSEEYKNKYYSMAETINYFQIKLEDIINNASKIVK